MSALTRKSLYLIAALVAASQAVLAQDCNLPAPGGGAAPPADWSGTTGGHFEGPAAVNMGSGILLSSDLTIIANGDLTISGTIRLPRIGIPGTPSPRITLASRNGTVKIMLGASIGGGNAAPSAWTQVRARPANANGKAGDPGSLIRLIGPQIEIKGDIIGNAGGMAERTIAKAAGPGGGNNAATAKGGAGGTGGHILLCAESITIGAIAAITAGEGGMGGYSYAFAGNGAAGNAWGGQGGAGGNVIFRNALISLGSQVSAGRGGDGSYTSADGGVDGGAGWSQAGNAGKGGTVKFEANARVSNNNVPIAGDGGALGGDAAASGGKGVNGAFSGDPGGKAEARGGNGGPAGDVPVVPLAAGGTVPGVAGRNGSGGRADASAGDGGDAILGWGGPSGQAMAVGGANGAGAAPPKPAVALPVPGGLRAGGVGGTAGQAGIP